MILVIVHSPFHDVFETIARLILGKACLVNSIHSSYWRWLQGDQSRILPRCTLNSSLPLSSAYASSLYHTNRLVCNFVNYFRPDAVSFDCGCAAREESSASPQYF